MPPESGGVRLNKKGIIISVSAAVGAVLLCVLLNAVTRGALTSTAVSVLASAKIISLADSVYINKTELELTLSDSPYQLVAAVYPDNAAVKKLEWSSDNAGVATVDENGIVTPRGSGHAYITVRCGDIKTGCEVTVYQPVESIKLNQPMMRVRAGREIQLTAKIEPDNATDKHIEWISTDEAVAIVDNDGYVLVTGAGSADIIAQSSNGKTAYCRILAIDAEPSPTPVPDPTPRPARTAPPASNEPQKGSGESETQINPVSPTDVIVEYPYSLDDMLGIQMGQNPRVYRGSVYASATSDEVREYLDPVRAYKNAYMKYQFVDLSQPVNADKTTLNSYLSGKGILSGMGQTFIDAANTYKVSELYLIAHSCLETGNGTSKLACGVSYNGTTVYNMFGIGAFDGDAVNGGAKYAYEHGWTTPEKAILGGAKFISESYINGEYRQNTLYKMLWNPNAPGKHQYATDIGWAVKQAQTMKRYYETFGVSARFEVPSYSD